MDMRMFDSAIARWVVLDPVVHHGQTPYNGFDGNPVYWADPSGADGTNYSGEGFRGSTYDYQGRPKYNDGGFYIPAHERGMANYHYNPNGMYANIGTTDRPVLLGDTVGQWVKVKVGTVVSWNDDNGDSDLEEIRLKNIYKYEFVGDAQGGGGGYDLGNLANGLGIAFGIKQEMWGYAIAQNFKSARNPWAFAGLRKSQQAWRTTNTLGKFGSKVLSATKGLGIVAGIAQVGLKGYEVYDKGYATTRDVFDIGINSAGVVAAIFFASNPIGWAVGAGALAYSIGTSIYDNYNEE